MPPIPKIPTSRRWPCSFLRPAAMTQVKRLGGNLMKRTFLVLALAVFSTAGCRAMYPNGGCGDPCHVSRSQHAPRPMGCGEAYGCGDACGCDSGRGGTCGDCVESSCLCQGGDCMPFQRYCGPACDGNFGNPCGTTGGNCPCTSCGNRGFGPGEYDCSPCGSPDWGVNGYRRPLGGDFARRTCDNQAGPHGINPAVCGNGYCCPCCGKPAPSCCCNSGDQNYNFNPGPPVAQTAYPYYTVRGPRDYFLANPPSIGPY
jgi:hypothetical protein